MNSRKAEPPRHNTGGTERAVGSPGDDSTRTKPPTEAERIAKVMARAGLCSRREAERWIADGRVTVNGVLLATPAVTVSPKDVVTVDGKPLPRAAPTRLWLFHKPRGCVTTNRDPQGRPTVFDRLPPDLPRIVTIGRLDFNTEGLLLLTNDGGLARVLELPATGWLRRYRVRAFGAVAPQQLASLAEGIAVDGVLYGSIEAAVERQQGDNLWLSVGLREGKNREVKRVLEHLGLKVNRLIRVSFGPFQLGDLPTGAVREIRGKVLRDQLGARLIAQAGALFETRHPGHREHPGHLGRRPAARTTPAESADVSVTRQDSVAERSTNTAQRTRRNRRTSPSTARPRS